MGRQHRCGAGGPPIYGGDVMALTSVRARKRPILAVFRFPGRRAVIALCWTMSEVAQAFQQARGA